MRSLFVIAEHPSMGCLAHILEARGPGDDEGLAPQIITTIHSARLARAGAQGTRE
jgi:hypothetical protein